MEDVVMRMSLALALCLCSGVAGQGNQEGTARSKEIAAVQAEMPRQYITPTVSQLEVGERGWINCKAVVVDDKFKCWLVKAAHVHDNAGDAGSNVEVVRTRAGFDVAVHMSYKWRTIPEAGLAADCFPVKALNFEGKKQAEQ
jgi:hypothetical protein